MYPPFRKEERLVPYNRHQKYPHKRRDMTWCVDRRARRYFIEKYESRFDVDDKFTDDQIEG